MTELSLKWMRVEKHVEREFVFKNFLDAISFVNKVADVAEGMDHHPDILIRYNKVKIMSWSHDVNGLSERDYKLAAKIDAIL